MSGAGNAYLQASVNPYITILGPLESAAKRISIMGICNKLAWPIPSIFIVWLIGKDVNKIGISDLEYPFLIIILAFVILGIMAFFAPLPEVKAEGEDAPADNVADESKAQENIHIPVPPFIVGVYRTVSLCRCRDCIVGYTG